MHLFEVSCGSCRVLALAYYDENCSSGKLCVGCPRCEVVDVLDYLSSFNGKQFKIAQGCFGLFDRFAEHGEHGFSRDIFHSTSNCKSIWRFEKGDIRVFCFFDGRKNLILTNAGLKAGQKKIKPRDAIAKALKARGAYYEGKSDE